MAGKPLYNEPRKSLLMLNYFVMRMMRSQFIEWWTLHYTNLSLTHSLLMSDHLHPPMISWIVLLHHNQPCLVHVCKKEEFAYLDKARPSNKVIDLPYLQMCTHYSLQALNGWKRPDLATNQLNSVSACRRGKSDIKPVIITSLVVRQHRVVYWTEYAWPQT